MCVALHQSNAIKIHAQTFLEGLLHIRQGLNVHSVLLILGVQRSLRKQVSILLIQQCACVTSCAICVLPVQYVAELAPHALKEACDY